MKEENGTLLAQEVGRRDFLKLGSLFAAIAGTTPAWLVPSEVHAATYGRPIPTEAEADTKNIYTVCLMCHSACGLKCLVNAEGRLVKVDGNPYHPNNRDVPLEYTLGQDDMAEDNNGNMTKVKNIRGRCCAKAQAAIETVYNPLRVKHPLKRVGPRGSGKWERISWDQAYTEIGARLQEIRDFTTPIVPGDTADASTVFGPKVNGLVHSGGRNEHGQKEFTDRFYGKSFGTVNKRHDHTSNCETSHHMAYKYMTNEVGASKGKTKMNADYRSAEYVLMFGFSAFEANFPMVPLARKTINMKTGERGEGSVNDGTAGKYVVADPRFSNTAAKADKWLPLKPGTDAALALAMGRHLLENDLIQHSFLKRPHKGALNTTNETCVSDASWLVNLETRDYLAPSEVDGLSDGTDKYGGTKVVIPEGGGSAVTADTVDAGELFFVGTVPRAGGGDPIPVKSVLQMYNDSTYNADAYATTGMPVTGDAAHGTAMDNWSSICGVERADIEQVAGEFGMKGLENRRCFAEFYRGPAQHTNGTYNGMAILSLNWLMGNVDFIGGGIVGGSHYHEDGSKSTNLYPKAELTDVADKDPLSDKGTQITRIKKSFTSSAAALLGESTDSPTKRPWFPFAQDHNYQEILPSIYDQYPYPCSALFFYWNDCAYSAPAHREIAKKTLTDESKVPLFVAIDIEFGETTVFADYILPDSTFLERWSTPHVASTMPVKISGVRQPVVGWINGTPVHQLSGMPAKADYRPILPDTRIMEDILIGLGKKMGLPGVGPNSFATGFNGDATDTSLDSAWDWHKRLLGNIAAEEGDAPVDGGGGPTGGGAANTNLDAINYILQRGGRFNKVADSMEVNDEYDSDGIHVAHKFGKLLQFYVPAFAQTQNTVKPDENFSGIAIYEPTRGAKGTQFDADSDYPLKLITYKQPYHSMARTVVNPTLMSLEPENSIELSPEDAAARGIVDGDQVRLISRSNPTGVLGRARVRQLRPGVVAVDHSYGHWEMGSKPQSIDGVGTSSDPDRGGGVQCNLVMDTDPDLSSSVCYQDLIGGSASFFDTPVQVIKV